MNTTKSWLDRVLAITNVIFMSLLVITVVYQVVARFFFNSPSSQLEEFSRVIFMWLILLGGVYVAGLNKHLSIDMFKGKLSPINQNALDICINLLILIFALLFLCYGGIEKMHNATAMTQITASLQWPMRNLYIVLPISGAILAFYAIHSILSHDLKSIIKALKIILLLSVSGVVLYFAIRWFLFNSALFSLNSVEDFISDYFPVIILFGSFFIMLFFGVPITFAIALSSFLCIVSTLSIASAVSIITQKLTLGFDASTLFAIPFFVLAGNIMNSGGIALRLINLAKKLVGFLPGSLVHCNILANAMFGAISGSAVAAAAAVGGIMSPMQEKEGYDPSFCAAANIASAPTGLLIPPSNVLIMYSLASGGVSISALFLAGYIPGLLMAFALMIVSGYIYLRKTKTRKQIVFGLFRRSPIIFFILLSITLLVSLFIYSSIVGYLGLALACLLIGFIAHKKSYDCASLFKVFLDAIPSLLLIIVVIGGIITGVFTATEGSAIAVVYTLVLSVVFYKEIKIGELSAILLDSVLTSTMVLLLVASSMGMSWAMTNADVPQLIAEGLSAFSDSPFLILLIMNIILLIVGTFMDITPAILIFTPIFLPLAKTMGIDSIQFGIMMVMNLSIGLCTPPVGSILFVGCGVAKVKIEQVIKPLIPMFLALFFVLFLITHFPQLSLYLPKIAGLLN